MDLRAFLLAYRHGMTFVRRLPSFLCLYIIVPIITLYGIKQGLGLPEAAGRFMVPGFMVNAAAASAFGAVIYGSLIRLTMQGSYNSWLAATLNVHHLVQAEVIWTTLRSMLVALGVGIGGSLVVGQFQWAAILVALPIVALTSSVCALIGLCIVSKAQGFDDVSLYEPVMAAIFVFSGVFASTTQFPAAIQWLMTLQPIYHGIHAVRPLFEGQWLTAAPWLHALALVGAAAVLYPISYLLFKKRLIT